jgi:hypothetical protein
VLALGKLKAKEEIKQVLLCFFCKQLINAGVGA